MNKYHGLSSRAARVAIVLFISAMASAASAAVLWLIDYRMWALGFGGWATFLIGASIAWAKESNRCARIAHEIDCYEEKMLIERIKETKGI